MNNAVELIFWYKSEAIVKYQSTNPIIPRKGERILGKSKTYIVTEVEYDYLAASIDGKIVVVVVNIYLE